jgi:3-isopropylmalate dehydratase small subunit
MATEMGAIIILFPPSEEIIEYCASRTGRQVTPVLADPNASYARVIVLDAGEFVPMVSRPGKPHDTIPLPDERIWIDSAFIGSCTNGRIEDLRAAASVLKNRKVAPGVVLKVVPATDVVWQQSLAEGLVETFKESGALLSNAGCAGCAAGQVGQNGPGEITISTGNRNFPGKQGQGEVYLASPGVVAASAVAGYITGPESLPAPWESVRYNRPDVSVATESLKPKTARKQVGNGRPVEVTGRVWIIPRDDIDTDMIYHNRYLSITDVAEMGQYTFDNLDGHKDFASRAQKGDLLVTGGNFGSGSSRQQAVDCFISLGIQCILARSFGAIYERNAINAAFPIMTCARIDELQLNDGDELKVNFQSGEIRNNTREITVFADPFSEVQMEIYQNNGLF